MADRVRCKRCGSTRVTAIVEAYCVGRVEADADGVLVVTGGRFEIHGEHELAGVHCQNCGHGEVRVERDRVPALPPKEN